MSHVNKALLSLAIIGLAGCSGNAAPPSSFSPAVHSDSGISATGQQGPQGGSAAPPSAAGSLATTPAH